ncbi:MAG TPA: flavodoxin domain-containing protein [Candidatus Bathyarchaeia archaeon]|nr:flavodoxin domain-containing protein [Candidatus Bathyarchaeia archaeon]
MVSGLLTRAAATLDYTSATEPYNTSDAGERISPQVRGVADFTGRKLRVGLNLTILVGTMTGTAEMVAQEVQTALESVGHAANIRMMDNLDAGVFAGGGTFLICTSTYGQGDVPDNAQEFFASLERDRPDLSAVTYGVIALGDLTYKDTFCEGGIRFDSLLTELGARRVGEMLKHDASSGTLPEEVAAQWIVPWAEAVETTGKLQ